MTDEELDALDAKLASQIGDDVAVIFDHEYLFKQSRAATAALRSRLTAANARADRAEAARDAMIAAEREACLKIVTDEAEYQLDVSRKQFTNKDVCGDRWKTTEWAWRMLRYAAATIRKRGDPT